MKMQGLMMHCPLTTSSILNHAVRANPEREIVSVEADGTRLRLTYAAMATRARRAASLLLELGIGSRDRVATLAWNSHRHLELYYAIPGIGAVCHTVNPRLDAATIGRIVADAQDGVLFFDVDFLEIARGLKDRSPIRRFVMLGPAGASVLDWPVGERRIVKLKQGRPVFGVELRIADGREAAGITPGELLVRGPGVASAYFGSDTAFGSWMPTGDIAEIDAQGYLSITDRAKDLIKSGGEWISPTELELLACQVDGVSQASAIAIPHARWGERPLLIVRRQPGASVDAGTILAHLERHLPRWQVPDRLEFIDAMPMGATGKVLKAELRRRFPA
ncbi:AMP-binding protein [Niveispirillum sp. KHB5.9]|uniref:AMP-binding protein n=1 Tax=Niveispirillum sp. KHB5.9 TaxID=3400269 RepID=UPI003A85B6F3